MLKLLINMIFYNYGNQENTKMVKDLILLEFLQFNSTLLIDKNL